MARRSDRIKKKVLKKAAVKKAVRKKAVTSKKRQKRELSDTLVFERIVFRRHTFLAVDQWRSLMEHRQAAVCQVRIGNEACATGFLVARDVVLTNYHVVQEVDPTTITVCFDVRGGQAAPTNTYQLASEGIVEFSDLDTLDYALLRLARTPRRPWISLSAHQCEANEPLIIIQHPGGSDLKLAFGMFHQNHGTDRVTYLINTDYGSSGSPCLATDLRLVALHSARHPSVVSQKKSCTSLVALVRSAACRENVITSRSC